MWTKGIPPLWRKEFDALRAQRPTSLLKPRLKKKVLTRFFSSARELSEKHIPNSP